PPPGVRNRLVMAARALRGIARGALLEGAEVAAHGRSPELVVERGGAYRSLDHDVEGGGDARGRAELVLPRPLVARDAQVRHREAGEPGLRLRAAPRGPLVPDLASGAGGGAREGRDGGRMVGRLHLS